MWWRCGGQEEAEQLPEVLGATALGGGCHCPGELPALFSAQEQYILGIAVLSVQKQCTWSGHDEAAEADKLLILTNIRHVRAMGRRLRVHGKV